MTLRAVHSNRTEALFGALVEALPPPDPFAAQTIVVGNHVMARWLSRELALARGICAGVEIATFDRFVERTWLDDSGGFERGLIALDRDQLTAALASVLADDSFVATLPPVAAYLAAAPAAGDRAGPRRVQLANHIARLTWQYAVTRPDWMPEFSVGQLPPELRDHPTAQWQATLFSEALARLARDAAPIPMLPWLRHRARRSAPRLAPVHVFGMSYLQRSQLEALTDLATTTEVTVYLLDPCAELWDDVAGRSAKRATDEPLLLPLWGRAVRDTLAALVERTGGDIADVFPPPRIDTARDAILADTARRAAPSAYPELPAGVQILACANPRRELEVVAAKIRAHLDAHPELRANQIAVWIASDTETYLALAPSAFEAVGVPCHLIDAPIDDRGRIGEAVVALLELPTCAMSRSDLLRIMTHPAVLASHPHVDVADWVRWTERLGIAHGRDAASHAGTYLADHPDKFHWDQGVRRLALGAYMIGAERGAAHVANIELLPEEVQADQQASAATYALLVRSLSADAAWLAAHEATLLEWSEIFVALIDSYLAGDPSDNRSGSRSAESSRDIERVRSILAGIARADLDGRRLGFREAREHAIRRLVSARSDRGEPLAHGVTIAPLRTHRAIPFDIACVVGLDEGQFPAPDHVSTLDVRAYAPMRRGDVSARDRDRHAFLDVVLGARRALYLSYVAAEPKTGQAVAPSSVVLELADALAPYVGAGSSHAAFERLTERHPLHRFAAGGDLILPATARERWAARVRDAMSKWLRERGLPVPDADGILALLDDPAMAPLRAELALVEAPIASPPAPAVRTLSIANLRSFLESPIQAWARLVLDLDELPDDAVFDHCDEPFHVERPTRAVVLREALGAHLRHPETALAAHYDAIVHGLELRGQFPVGVFGAAARAVDLRTLERWRQELGPVPVGAATRIAFGRAAHPLDTRVALAVELVPAIDLAPHSQGSAVHPGRAGVIDLAPHNLALPLGRTVRIIGTTELLLRSGDRTTSVIPILGTVDGKSRHHLRGAFDHVALAAAGLGGVSHDHILLDLDGRVARVSHEPWTQADARAFLGELARELLDEHHGYLLPFDVLARAAGGKRSARAFHDPTGGLGYGPVERRDGLDLPTDVAEIAKRRLGPLVSRMRGDHSFE